MSEKTDWKDASLGGLISQIIFLQGQLQQAIGIKIAVDYLKEWCGKRFADSKDDEARMMREWAMLMNVMSRQKEEEAREVLAKESPAVWAELERRFPKEIL